MVIQVGCCRKAALMLACSLCQGLGVLQCSVPPHMQAVRRCMKAILMLVLQQVTSTGGPAVLSPPKRFTVVILQSHRCSRSTRH